MRQKCAQKKTWLKVEISDEQSKTQVTLKLSVFPWHWNELDTSIRPTCSPDSTERKQKSLEQAKHIQFA